MPDFLSDLNWKNPLHVWLALLVTGISSLGGWVAVSEKVERKTEKRFTSDDWDDFVHGPWLGVVAQLNDLSRDLHEIQKRGPEGVLTRLEAFDRRVGIFLANEAQVRKAHDEMATDVEAILDELRIHCKAQH